MFFNKIVSDRSFPELLEHDDNARKFFGIQSSDFTWPSKYQRLQLILEPLAALGLIRMQHSGGAAATVISSGGGVEDGNGGGPITRGGNYNQTLPVTCGMHTVIQSAARYHLKLKNNFSNSSVAVVQFMFDSMQAALQGTDTAYAEALIPHVVHALTHCHVRGGFGPGGSLSGARFRSSGGGGGGSVRFLSDVSKSDDPHSAVTSPESTQNGPIPVSPSHTAAGDSPGSVGGGGGASEDQDEARMNHFHRLSFDLCEMTYEFARFQGMARDAEKLALKALSLLPMLGSNADDSDDQASSTGRRNDAGRTPNIEEFEWTVRVGECQAMQGRMTMAAKRFQDAIVIYERVRGTTGLSIGQVYRQLGKIYQSQNSFDLAELYYSNAVNAWKGSEISRQAAGKQGEDKNNANASLGKDLTAVLNELAFLKKKQGKFKEALELYKSCLNAATKLYGPHHEVVVLALNNIALLLKRQKSYEDAKVYFRRAIAVYEQMYGGLIHSDVGKSMSCMAECLREQGRYSEAEELYRSASDIFKKLSAENNTSGGNSGETHSSALVDVALSQNALAMVLADQGRYDEALTSLERILSIYKDLYGPEDGRVAACLNQIGQLLKTMCKLNEAVAYFNDALSIWEKAK
eukprot:gene2662-3226_t